MHIALTALVMALLAAFLACIAWRNGVCDGYDYACRPHDPLFEQNGVCDILRSNGRDLSSDATTDGYIEQLCTTIRRQAATLEDYEKRLASVSR